MESEASTRVQLLPGQLPERGCVRSISRSTPILANALRLGLRPQPRSNDFPATRTPVPARTAQTWLRRFNSAFASRWVASIAVMHPRTLSGQ
jgi:hypothetical protein